MNAAEVCFVHSESDRSDSPAHLRPDVDQVVTGVVELLILDSIPLRYALFDPRQKESEVRGLVGQDGARGVCIHLRRPELGGNVLQTTMSLLRVAIDKVEVKDLGESFE